MSYPHLVYQSFLPLILSDTYPADTFVCTSQAASVQAQKLLGKLTEDLSSRVGGHVGFNGTFEVIPFGVDTNIFYPRNRRASREQLGLDKDAFTVLYVGRVSPVDKADLIPFLRWVKELSHRILPQRLRILIAGGSHNGYEEVLSDYIAQANLRQVVKVLNRVPNSDLPSLYCAADVFIALSDNIQECLGLSAIEAMACGVPQVVGDWSGLRDTVEDGVTGFRIPTYWADCEDQISLLAAAGQNMWQSSHFTLAQSVAIDINILLDRLTMLASHPAVLLDMAEASLRRAKTVYDWAVIVKKYERLIDRKAQESSKYKTTATPRAMVSAPQYFAMTAHFASRIISDDTVLRPNKLRGDRAPQESKRYVEHFRTLEKAFVDNPGRLVYEYGLAASMADYKKYISNETGCSQNEAMQHVMWLIKYGYLEIAHQT